MPDAPQPTILLAAYGSRHPRARPAFDALEARIRARFPGHPMAWSFTSRNVRRRLPGTLSPHQALLQLADQGTRRVVVQSLHIIPGGEYDETLAAASALRDRFEAVTVGAPLLASDVDLRRVALALAELAKPDLDAGRAAVFMGHGTEHPGNIWYARLAKELERIDPRLVLDTLEAGNGPTAVVRRLATVGATCVGLHPFLLTAGMHAQHDMAGDDPDSWRSVLATHGIEARPDLRGAAEFPPLADIWLDHLAEALPLLD